MNYLYWSFIVAGAVVVIYLSMKISVYLLDRQMFNKNERLLFKMINKLPKKASNRDFTKILEQIDIVNKERKIEENKKKLEIRKQKLEKLKSN